MSVASRGPGRRDGNPSPPGGVLGDGDRVVSHRRRKTGTKLRFTNRPGVTPPATPFERSVTFDPPC